MKRTCGMVKLRGGFSDRYNIIDFNKIQQVDEFDDDTRIRVCNKLHFLLEEIFTPGGISYFRAYERIEKIIGTVFYNDLCNDVFCTKNTMQKGIVYDWHRFSPEMDAVIEHATYNEVLDLLQYVCQWVSKRCDFNKNRMFEGFNELFEKEYVGYRFLEGYVVPITDETELREISEACNIPYKGTRSHMKKAVQFLSDRQTKNYKKCIDESILAVESICKIITGNDNAVLSDALKEIEKKNGIHPSLKQGFIKLYAYTSDQGGIRHAEGLFESNVSFDEAKYFLVSCSAFVNYLIAEYATGSN